MNIPNPTGEYSVGSVAFTFTDASRVEKIGPKAGTEKKKITARVFYPVRPEDTKDKSYAYLMSRQVAAAMGKEYFVKIDYDKKCETGEMNSRYYEGVDPVPDKKFPLIVYSHGYLSYMESNTFLCSELASRGYVVVAIAHSYEAMAVVHEDGEECYFHKPLRKQMTTPMIPGYMTMIKMQKMKGTAKERRKAFVDFQEKYSPFLVDRVDEWVDDTLAVIEQMKTRFADRIDFSAGIGATGHSMGGAVAYALCQRNPEITCGINIDGGLFGRYEGMTMTKPFFQICSEANYPVMTQPMLDKTEPAYYAVFKKMKHIGFADIKFMVPVAAVTGKIPAQLAHDTLCKCHVDFFDKYLKRKDIEISIEKNEYIDFEIF